MRQRLEPITWVLDGQELTLPQEDPDWQATMGAMGGYDTAQLTVDFRQAKHAGQGAPLTAYRRNGDVLWWGRLATDPVLEGARLVRLNGRGTAVVFQRKVEPLFYQEVGVERWVSSDSDPHNYSNSPRYALQQGTGRLAWQIQSGQTYNNGTEASYLRWVPNGGPITRVTFVVHKSLDLTNWQVALQRADGKSSARSDVATWALGAAGTADGTEVTRKIEPGAVQVALTLKCTVDASTVSNNQKVWLTKIRVWGQGITQAYPPSSIAVSLGERLGLDTENLVTASTVTDALPLVHDGSWAELMDYLCVMDDYRWGVVEPEGRNGPQQLEYGPWSDDPWVVLSGPEDENLEPEEVYNVVRVRFETDHGAFRTKTYTPDDVDAEDPLDKYGVQNEYLFELPDVAQEDTLADRIGTGLIKQLLEPRVSGTLRVPEMRRGGERRSPYALRAGDTVRLHSREGLGPQRVYRVTYSPAGVTAEIGRDLGVARVLARASRKPPRSR